MDFDVRDLELLDALATGGTLQQAADRLYVSQPALSQRLLKMEERLGTPLFDRVGRRLVPNLAGKRLLPRASRILADLGAAEQEVREVARYGDRTIRLATQCATTFSWLTPVMRELRINRPDSLIRVQNIGDEDPVDALLAQRIDVAVVTKLHSTADQVRLTHLMDDDMLAVVAPTHPWATRDHVTGPDFATENLILYDTYDPSRPNPTQPPLPPGAHPARLTLIPILTELFIELIVAGEGVGVLPSWVAAPFVARGEIATVRIGPGGDTRPWYAGVRSDDDRPHIQDFVTLIRSHFTAAPEEAASR
ncbi:LysR family transcriptional regulator [Nocardia crassostreae]|uniref:LysR family transcriptional regulator n=1 Tax=Nocardia crassostreae TaxID=53428 RepID=UPI0008296C38|nr:LysR family transcriptional regulator [Nocardia crassostreae]